MAEAIEEAAASNQKERRSRNRSDRQVELGPRPFDVRQREIKSPSGVRAEVSKGEGEQRGEKEEQLGGKTTLLSYEAV